jgi:hypothetical protein
MRLSGRERLGFYPLPLREAERIRRFLVFPDKQCCAFDPCVGDGAAFAEIASDKNVQRCGVELDTGRAELARISGIEVIHGDCFDVQCPVESFSLIYLNPPYDFVGPMVYARTEPTKGDYAVARARMLTSSGQGQQANVSQMDWSGPTRAAHSNTGRERINLMGVAKDFLEESNLQPTSEERPQNAGVVADWPTTQNVAI